MPLSELNKIRTLALEGNSILTKNISQSNKNELVKMKEVSDSKVKNWPNTIYTKQKKIEQQRFEKFKKEEEERRKIDKEEEEYRENERRILRERAKELIFQRGDKVKAFNSKLMLCDVMKEREYQLLIKQRQKEIQQEIDKFYDDIHKKKLEEYDKKEILKAKSLENKKKVIQNILKNQHEEFKNAYIDKLKQAKIEGLIIKKKAEEAIAEEKTKKEKELQKNKQMVQNFKDFNKKQIEIQKINKLKEKEEEAKIEEYSKNRELMLKKRKEDADERSRLKQAQKQRIIDKVCKDLEEKERNRVDLLNTQIKEREKKEDDELELRRKKREDLKQDIDNQIKYNLTVKDKKRKEELEKDKLFQNKFKSKTDILTQLDETRKKEQRQNLKELAQIHLKQAVL